jgi:hypothetical protein
LTVHFVVVAFFGSWADAHSYSLMPPRAIRYELIFLFLRFCVLRLLIFLNDFLRRLMIDDF